MGVNALEKDLGAEPKVKCFLWQVLKEMWQLLFVFWLTQIS